MRIHIKNMVSNRCKLIVKSDLAKFGFHSCEVELGNVDILENITPQQLEHLDTALRESGLEILHEKKDVLIQGIKTVIVELVHYSDEQLKTNLSDYLSEKLHYDYGYLSNLFSQNENTTIEHFFLSHKIEKIKELLIYDELTLSEIMHKMHYSSLGHLSSQFKRMTGLTLSEYKNLKLRIRKPLEDI